MDSNENSPDHSSETRPKWMRAPKWAWIPGIVVFPFLLFGLLFGLFLDGKEGDIEKLIYFFMAVTVFYCIGVGISLSAKDQSGYCFVGYSLKQWLWIPPLTVVLGTFLGFFLRSF